MFYLFGSIKIEYPKSWHKFCNSLTEFMKMNNRHSGFTLAEILITLGLIGVIAAMTLPALIGGINKKTIEARLKEDYSLLQQVMQKAQFEDASFSMSIPNNMQGSKDWFKSFIEPNMKYANVCFNTSGC